MFTKRPSNQGILFVGNYNPGHPLKQFIENGDFVTLYVDEVAVLVNAVQAISKSCFSGVVYGFEPSSISDSNGLQVEQVVKFHDSQIFGCRSA